MSAFDSAWRLLKLLPSEEKKFGQGYGDFETEEYDHATGNYYPSEEEMDDYRQVMDAPPPRPTPQMDDDPFRMTGPDMSDQIEQILAEIHRRKERKSLRNVFNEDGTGKPEFDKYGVMDRTRELGEFDRIDPQDIQLLNFTRPQMNDRLDALQAEFARRSAKRAGKQ